LKEIVGEEVVSASDGCRCRQPDRHGLSTFTFSFTGEKRLERQR